MPSICSAEHLFDMSASLAWLPMCSIFYLALCEEHFHFVIFTNWCLSGCTAFRFPHKAERILVVIFLAPKLFFSLKLLLIVNSEKQIKDMNYVMTFKTLSK